jgi:hypothetical protein
MNKMGKGIYITAIISAVRVKLTCEFAFLLASNETVSQAELSMAGPVVEKMIPHFLGDQRTARLRFSWKEIS